MDLMTRRRALMATTESGSRLPSEYQEVAWISTNGDQRVMTDVTITSPTSVTETKVATLSSSQYSRFKPLLMARDSNAYAVILAGKENAYIWQNRFLNFLDDTEDPFVDLHSMEPFDTPNVITVDLDFVAQKRKCYYDGTLVSDSGYTSDISKCNTPFYLFTFLTSSSVETSRRLAVKLYYLKYSENGVYKLNCVPCYRKTDNVIGLYNLANGSFYTNNAGTGNFTKGPNVN